MIDIRPILCRFCLSVKIQMILAPTLKASIRSTVNASIRIKRIRLANLFKLFTNIGFEPIRGTVYVA